MRIIRWCEIDARLAGAGAYDDRAAVEVQARLTNAFSKKLANHRAAVALYFVHYNFARVHQTLRVTPAMEAGIANHVWTLREIIGLLS